MKLGSNNYRNDSSATTPGVAPSPGLDTAQGNEAASYFGDRLTVVLDLGSSNFKFKLKVGAEYQKRTARHAGLYTSPTTRQPKDPVEIHVQKGVGASMQL